LMKFAICMGEGVYRCETERWRPRRLAWLRLAATCMRM
jgi:hypothetical protein